MASCSISSTSTAAITRAAVPSSVRLKNYRLPFLSLSSSSPSPKIHPRRLLPAYRPTPLFPPCCRHWQLLVAFSSGVEDSQSEDCEYGDEVGEAGGSRLYVGNLSYSITPSQLSDLFQEAGVVDNVEIIYDRVTDRSRGFAFVTMRSLDEANKAIQMFNGSQVGGRIVRVNFPEVPRGGEREVMTPMIRSSNRAFVNSPHKIYAGNLGWSLTSEPLREAFADQRGLLGAKVIYDKTSGRSRGFGFVSFSTSDDAGSALNAMNGVEVAGRPLRLNLAVQRTIAATDTSQISHVEEASIPLSNCVMEAEFSFLKK